MNKKIVIASIILLLTTKLQPQGFKTGIGINIGTNILLGETPLSESKLAPNFGVYGIYQHSHRWSYKFQMGIGRLGVALPAGTHWTTIIPVEIWGIYTPFNSTRFIPFLQLGAGGLSFTLYDWGRFYDAMIMAGGGVAISVGNKLSFFLSSDVRLTSGDDFNGIHKGLPDGYINIQTGFAYHFNKPGKGLKHEYEEEIPDSAVIAQLMGEEMATVDTTQQAIDTTNSNQSNTLLARIEELKYMLQEKDKELQELREIMAIRDEKIRQMMTSSASSWDVERRYQGALNLFYDRNYQLAIDQFKQLITQYPSHPLASNFRYWIGECYYSLHDFDAAIEAFEQVLNFEKSYKKDDALIMLGLCYLKLGDADKANENFYELLERYPESEFAEKARRYIN